MVAYVFPGQGSQAKGMGGELFGEFSYITKEADEILGYSIKELCLEDPKEQLGQTQFTQPALYTVNALCYLKKLQETGEKPDYVAGHSLAEYNALFAAGVFDFKTGLRLVKKRGELMSQASEGGMAAVIGLTEEKVKEILQNNNLTSIDIANLNTPTQIVLSGLKDEIENAMPIFKAAGARNYVVLKVSGAFHSRYMEPSRKMFEEFIEQFEFNDIQIPIISNIHARPYKKEAIKINLVEQITHSVKWTETVRYLMGKGVAEILQIGPGTVLTGLIRTIQRESEPLIVDETEELNNDADKTVSVKKAGKGRKKKNEASSVDKVHDVKNENKKEEEISETVIEKSESAVKRMEEEEKEWSTAAAALGNPEFKKEYNLKYAYIAGGMYKGISSKELVVGMGRAGMMGVLGAGGVDFSEVENDIKYIQNRLANDKAYAVNLLYNPSNAKNEEKLVDLLLKYNVKTVEASGFLSITPSIVKYRLKGLSKNNSGGVQISNRIIAKASRPEVIEAFLSPAPERIVKKLLEENVITTEEAELSKNIPIADDICVEGDSAGHTDGSVLYTIMPVIRKLRDEIKKRYGYSQRVRIGGAGGLGTPEGMAMALILGADFIVTGSINQCTVEARTSDIVKDMLQKINVYDTAYAPATDMFEMGAKVQVLKKGLFFPARANKLFELYKQYNSFNEIDSKTKAQLQEKYFKRSFDELYKDIKSRLPSEEIEKAERNPKYKMALAFKWYLMNAFNAAIKGEEELKLDYQIQCGPALGAFNQWVKDTKLENWKNRHVDEIGLKLMMETAKYLKKSVKQFS
ncbi:ACP S-malonyltransferase [Ruminiclostridium cellulolyticum]|uniref:[acyl-carrier-protein] S-malonyltransferase n=1 Tax=Ruminiclostridium cellulolyticum (strain ATCC 35319 / DSM 5812 / JCM 6584 / H10) TaxID=394503 RepID=B8I8J3_RUMCH|nr:ACP S-malonyltransferase [Ruminiclostridium cellulolyticum]ACL75226.1 PfaD family protein [Ruminiclostridium cellulolyticum H10]